MKKYTFAVPLILLFVAIFLLAGEEDEGKPDTQGPAKSRPGSHRADRAQLAKVTAGSFRLSRLKEIPRAKEFSSILMDRKNNWPRRLPLYTADGSPITFWATSENKEEYLNYDFKNRVADTVRIDSVRVLWGQHQPRRFRILLSPDGENWKVLAEQKAPYKEDWSLSFSKPVRTRHLRLVCHRSRTGEGFSVKKFAVYGTRDKPAHPTGLRAKAVDKKSVELKWKGASGGGYQYCVFRSKEQGFTPERANRLACVDRQEYIDVVPEGGAYYYAVTARGFGGSQSSFRRTGPIELSGPPGSPFQYRGVVEGFYNDPWPHQERLKMISFMSRTGMNYYIYAPKHDPYHRQWWRKPYPDEELDNFRELLLACRAHGITFNFGISPGLDYNYDESDFRKLCDKLDSLYKAGVRSYTLCMDDITGWKEADAEMAARQVKLANRLYERLQRKDPRTGLFFVPTVYMRTCDYWKENKRAYAEYLEQIKGLDPEIEVMWTGPGMIFSEEISSSSARGMEEVWDRKPVIWDNVPVNDVTLRHNIIMAPYQGRDAKLYRHCKGALLNPMYLPNSSMITVYTAGRYLESPQSYSTGKAYEEAIRAIAGPDHDSFKALADTLACHPLFPEQGVDDLPVTKKIDAYREAVKEGEGVIEARENMKGLFEKYVRLPLELDAELDNFALKKELEPAASKLAHYGKAGISALEYLEAENEKSRKELARRTEKFRDKAREIPWKVADNSLEGLYTPPGSKKGRHENVMERFLKEALSR